MSKTMHCSIVLVVSTAWLLAGAAAALAHAQLLRAVPAAGGNVSKAPNGVTLRFSEKLENAFSSICRPRCGWQAGR